MKNNYFCVFCVVVCCYSVILRLITKTKRFVCFCFATQVPHKATQNHTHPHRTHNTQEFCIGGMGFCSINNYNEYMGKSEFWNRGNKIKNKQYQKSPYNH